MTTDENISIEVFPSYQSPARYHLVHGDDENPTKRSAPFEPLAHIAD
jgi:hypothetical protein